MSPNGREKGPVKSRVKEDLSALPALQIESAREWEGDGSVCFHSREGKDINSTEKHTLQLSWYQCYNTHAFLGHLIIAEY